MAFVMFENLKEKAATSSSAIQLKKLKKVLKKKTSSPADVDILLGSIALDAMQNKLKKILHTPVSLETKTVKGQKVKFTVSEPVYHLFYATKDSLLEPFFSGKGRYFNDKVLEKALHKISLSTRIRYIRKINRKFLDLWVNANTMELFESVKKKLIEGGALPTAIHEHTKSRIFNDLVFTIGCKALAAEAKKKVQPQTETSGNAPYGRK